MSSGRAGSSTSIGCVGFFLALLQVSLIVLKLTDVIEWEWWLVLLPIAVYLVFAALAIVAFVAVMIYVYFKNK